MKIAVCCKNIHLICGLVNIEKKILLKKKHKTNISFFLEQNFKFKRRCEENFRETFLFLSCLAKLKKNCKKCKKLENLKKKNCS